MEGTRMRVLNRGCDRRAWNVARAYDKQTPSLPYRERALTATSSQTIIFVLFPLGGIGLDVLPNPIQVSLVTNNMFIVIALPYLKLELEALLTYCRRCTRFEPTYDIAQSWLSCRSRHIIDYDDPMEMIGHHDMPIVDSNVLPTFTELPPGDIDDVPSPIQMHLAVANIAKEWDRQFATEGYVICPGGAITEVGYADRASRGSVEIWHWRSHLSRRGRRSRHVESGTT